MAPLDKANETDGRRVSTAAEPRPRQFAFLLVPNFPMLAFASAIEPLRIANWLSGNRLYEWLVATRDGKPVQASNGLLLTPHGSIKKVAPPELLLVCAGVGGCFFQDDRTFAWLRGLARRGAALGAIDTGSWLLARAGVLSGHRCTVHWEDIPAFRDAFPDLDVTDNLFEVDGRRMTCSGGTATMDFVLRLVAEDHGREFAGSIAEEFMQEQVREGSRYQRMDLSKRTGISDPRLLSAIVAMEQHVEEPISLAEVGEACGSSVRNLERLFTIHLRRSPSAYYREIRLNAARQLLLHGSWSILDVALSTGFVSASHFSRCYRTAFGRSPRDERMQSRFSIHAPD